jgi:hypothetical protein
MSELYAKPRTLRAATLSDMAELLREQRARGLDVVAPAGSISSRGGVLVLEGTEVALDADGVTPTAGQYRLTETAERGIADKLRIPQGYLRRMREEHIDLYDNNVNEWLRRSDAKYLVRVLRAEDGGEADELVAHGIVRAFLSNGYRIIDNIDVLTAALRGISDAGVHVEVRGADLTEKRMSVKVWAPAVAALAPALLAGYRSPFDGGAVRVGDGGWSVAAAREAAAREGMGYKPGTEPVLFAGFGFGNSETGEGQFTVWPELVVQICGNGLTVKAEAQNKRHVGARMDEGVVEWSAETQRRNLDLITSQVTDAVRKWLSPEFVAAKAAELEADAGVPVEADTVKLVAKKLAFSDAEADSILEHFILGGQRTAGGVMQAVSSVAQTVEDGDLASELEAQAIPAMKLAARAPALVGAGSR